MIQELNITMQENKHPNDVAEERQAVHDLIYFEK